MEEDSAFPKASALLEPHHQILIVISRTFEGDLPRGRYAIGVFYSSSRLGQGPLQG